MSRQERITPGATCPICERNKIWGGEHAYKNPRDVNTKVQCCTECFIRSTYRKVMDVNLPDPE